MPSDDRGNATTRRLVVAGTVALMLQANPSLTPNLVKAILQFTAEARDPYDALTQGAGFLNARGAVELAQAIATGTAVEQSASHDPTPWSGHVIWGNHRVGGGELRVNASAWRTDVVWGSTRTPEGGHVALGTASDGDRGDEAVWSADAGAADAENVVWGSACGGRDCDAATLAAASTPRDVADLVWAASSTGDNDPSTALATGTIGWGTNARGETGDIVWRAPVIRPRSRALVPQAARR